MADYVELLGVRTWYDDYGEGEAVVLLHPGGAGVDARAWRPNLEAHIGRVSSVHAESPAATAALPTLRVRSRSI